jgi:hypothetical protein
MNKPVSILVIMKTTVVCIPLVLLVLSCSRQTDVAENRNTAGGFHEKGTVPALAMSESSWLTKQGVGWENLRAWVPAADESLWTLQFKNPGSNKPTTNR